jgi:hypothetical protein
MYIWSDLVYMTEYLRLKWSQRNNLEPGRSAINPLGSTLMMIDCKLMIWLIDWLQVIISYEMKRKLRLRWKKYDILLTNFVCILIYTWIHAV